MTPIAHPAGERIGLAAFIAMSVFAGGNGVAIRFSNRELDPMWGAALRFWLATALLLTVMGVMRLKPPRGRVLMGTVLYGALTFGAAFGLGYYALVQMHAGLGQTLLALVPLMTMLLAAAHGQERLRVRGGMGALVALVGVVVVTGGGGNESVPLDSLVATIGSAACFAEAGVLLRRLPSVHPITTNAIGMATGAMLLTVVSLAGGAALTLPVGAQTWIAIAYLVVVSSVIVFGLYLVVLRHWPASRASFEFVLIPVMTVALSAWLDSERLDIAVVVGGVLVLIGVYLGAIGPTACGQNSLLMSVFHREEDPNLGNNTDARRNA